MEVEGEEIHFTEIKSQEVGLSALLNESRGSSDVIKHLSLFISQHHFSQG